MKSGLAVRRFASGLATILCVTGTSAAQDRSSTPLPEVHAARAITSPVIDGRLIDEVWNIAEPVTTFTQRDPDEGRPPTEQTEIRFLFDDDALYVAARLLDSEPQRITRRLSTRDN